MLGPHPGVPIEIVPAKRKRGERHGGWLLVQRNPAHGWNDHLAWFANREHAEASRERHLRSSVWNMDEEAGR